MSEGIVVQAAVPEGVVLPLSPELLEGAVRHVLTEERVGEAEISLAFVSDEEIARMNEAYLRHEGATDVISFALHGEGERPLGDVYVGVEQAARQAQEIGVSHEQELLRLAVHGTLHVLGWEHPDEGERAQTPMYLRQEELLTSFLSRSSSAASRARFSTAGVDASRASTWRRVVMGTRYGPPQRSVAIAPRASSSARWRNASRSS